MNRFYNDYIEKLEIIFNTIVKNDKTPYYEGERNQEGQPHGYGTMYYPKTEENHIYKYVGNWKNGNKHGKAKEIDYDSLEVKGEWNNNRCLDQSIKLYNEYPAVKIGSQIWMSENLNVTHFRNGVEIPQAKNLDEWRSYCKNGKPAWKYYNFNKSYDYFGLLYNRFVIDSSENIAPKDWKIPDISEGKILYISILDQYILETNFDLINKGLGYCDYLKSTELWKNDTQWVENQENIKANQILQKLINDIKNEINDLKSEIELQNQYKKEMYKVINPNLDDDIICLLSLKQSINEHPMLNSYSEKIKSMKSSLRKKEEELKKLENEDHFSELDRHESDRNGLDFFGFRAYPYPVEDNSEIGINTQWWSIHGIFFLDKDTYNFEISLNDISVYQAAYIRCKDG
jgi:uncharacterized protein (TIGR02145 family)